MARTKIRSKIASSFIQPNIGDTVVITADPTIAWLEVGIKIHIVGGGIYEITSNIMYSWVLRLITAEVEPGIIVDSNTFYPIYTNNDLAWGAKEW